MKKKCPWCNCYFGVPLDSDGRIRMDSFIKKKCCSFACHSKLRFCGKRKLLTCQICGKQFSRVLSQIVFRRNSVCSRKCRHDLNAKYNASLGFFCSKNSVLKKVYTSMQADLYRNGSGINRLDKSIVRLAFAVKLSKRKLKGEKVPCLK